MKVLPFETKKEISDYMKNVVSKSLAVKCSHCHNLKDYSSDENPHKVIAREMIKMVQQINDSYMAPMKFEPIACWTCHRGDPLPERDPSGDKKASHSHSP